MDRMVDPSLLLRMTITVGKKSRPADGTTSLYKLDMSIFSSKYNLLFTSQFLLNQFCDSIQMAFFIDKIKIIRADLQNRAEVEGAHPVIIERIQQL